MRCSRSIISSAKSIRNAYSRYRAIVSRHGISISTFRYHVVTTYISMTSAMPDTMAEKRNTTGIIGVDHHGFALIEPKMNPTYPCNRKADRSEERRVGKECR